MNKLVPTPRVDKNGRTVIRHMKLDEANAPSASLVGSKPTLSGSEDDYLVDMSDSEFLFYLYPDDPELSRYVEPFAVLSRMTPDLRESIVSFIDLDNDNGSEAVKSYLLRTLESIRTRMRNAYPIRTRVDDLTMDTESYGEALTVLWSVGSLSDEAPEYFGKHPALVYAMSAAETHRYMKRSGNLGNYRGSRDYWRAVCAASMIFPYFSEGWEEEVDGYELRESTRWMERQSNLGDIIRVGVERGLNDPESIKAILYSESHSSLESGVL